MITKSSLPWFTNWFLLREELILKIALVHFMWHELLGFAAPNDDIVVQSSQHENESISNGGSNGVKISVFFLACDALSKSTQFWTAPQSYSLCTGEFVRSKPASFSVKVWLETLSVKRFIVACRVWHATMELFTESVSSQSATEKDASFHLSTTSVWKNLAFRDVFHHDHRQSSWKRRDRAEILMSLELVSNFA